MAVRTKKARPGMKLKLGASVLVAARAVDTHTVKESLRRFEEAHRSYVEAQSKVDATQSALDAARARVSTLHAAQGDAVDTLMRVLIWSGYPRKNPFAPCGAPSPSTIGRLAITDGVEAIRGLVARVLRTKGVSEKSVQAAQAALDAARAVEQARDSLPKLQDEVRSARVMRDAVGVQWDSALRALRLKVLAAADDGAPGLYAVLFPPMRRRVRKRDVVASVGPGGQHLCRRD